MRVLGAIFSAALLVGILAGIVWQVRYSESAKEARRAERQAEQDAAIKQHYEDKEDEKALLQVSSNVAEPFPELSETGPYPKAHVEERTYEFGTMAKDAEQSHNFTIENRGDVPLKLSKGSTTCRCTIHDLPTRELAPGASVTIEVSWTPRDIDTRFRKEARVRTNDPENREIRFLVSGSVVEKFLVSPSHRWEIGEVPEDESAECVGFITSRLFEEFKVLGIESENPLLTAEAIPLDAEKLKRFKSKSGYEYKVQLAPGIPVGPFQTQLRIRTDIDDETVIKVVVTAYRAGPLRFLAAIGGLWNTQRMSLNLGRFPASEGKSVVLPLFVRGLDEEFKIVSFETNVDSLQVTLEADTGFTSQDRRAYRLKFEVPAGKLPYSRALTDPGKVTLKTNHPDVSEFDIELLYVSY